jgi:flagellar hook-associated protein 2
VPEGYTQTVNAVTPPPQTPTPVFTAADLDAEIELEGQFTRTSSSNTLSDVIEHVTLNLTGVGETTVSVDRDLAAVQSSAQAIAKSYSDLIATLGKLGGAALRGERAALGGIERELRAVLGSRVDVDSAFSNAFETGFSTLKNGSLSLDTTTFGKALAQDFDGLARLFADPDRGIAKRLFELADNYLDTGALLDGRNAGLSRQVRETESRRSAMDQRLKIVEERLLRQYNNLDLVVNRLQGTNSALGSQLEAITGFYRQNRA